MTKAALMAIKYREKYLPSCHKFSVIIKSFSSISIMSNWIQLNHKVCSCFASAIATAVIHTYYSVKREGAKREKKLILSCLEGWKGSLLKALLDNIMMMAAWRKYFVPWYCMAHETMTRNILWNLINSLKLAAAKKEKKRKFAPF